MGMPRNRYYFYDQESCSFVEVTAKRSRAYVQGISLLIVALLFASALSWGVDAFTQTPQELALMAENEALRGEISGISERVDSYSEDLRKLSESDQELYRTLFQAESISDDVRQVGVGGSDPYENYGRFSTQTGSLLKETAAKLDVLERQINLQNTSYRELSTLADDRAAQLRQMPAILPANGPVVSGYGRRLHPILGVRKMHHGLDVLVDSGTPVVASGDGIVRRTEFSASYGNYVMIEHPASGFTTLYAHLSEIDAKWRPGRRINRGDVLGFSGSTGRSTGPHVHYEVRNEDGETMNPIYFFAPSMTPAEYQRLVEETENTTISLD
jgi:murein DD-endopeptidase MepM/ murein hydrolase activator NlpD